jgi:hypothetical protein
MTFWFSVQPSLRERAVAAMQKVVFVVASKHMLVEFGPSVGGLNFSPVYTSE